MPQSGSTPEPRATVSLPHLIAGGSRVFDRYRLVRELGRGGFGVVWLARDEELEIDVALKFLPDLVARDEESIAELKKEIKRGLALNHTGIVRVHNFLRDEVTAAISMEYVGGPTLRTLRREQPGVCFDACEIWSWVRQLGEVLAYVHERVEMVHRDLKPGNLMLTAAGELKVADFGIASSVSDSMTRISLAAPGSGTPAYMSPQQALGEPPAVTDDIYAVGATIYELLTGKPPFFRGDITMQVQGVTPPRMSERRRELGVESRSAIPEEWERVVADCLAKDATKRPPSMRALVKALENVVYPEPETEAPTLPEPPLRAPAQRVPAIPPPVQSNAPTLVQETSTRPRLPEPARTSWGWLALSGIAVMALGAGAAWYLEKVKTPTAAPASATPVPVAAATPAPPPAPDAEQIFREAWASEQGEARPRDVARAMKLYERASGLGHARSGARLARFYAFGEGVKRDLTRVPALAGAAAAANDPLALYLLGMRDLEAPPAERNPKRGLEYFQRAADLGVARAKDDLAAIYRKGGLVQKDAAKADTLAREAFEIWQLDAKTGDLDAITNLGLLYESGQVVQRDSEKAVEFYRQAAERGFAVAQTNLGYCYQHGFGLEIDLAKAIAWFEKAAAQGHARAQVNLGRLYDEPGPERDLRKAIAYYTQAAEQDNAAALNNLGVCYMQGHGVLKDPGKAREFYERAIQLGSDEARTNLNRLNK